jgi:hypothetical protein
MKIPDEMVERKCSSKTAVHLSAVCLPTSIARGASLKLFKSLAAINFYPLILSDLIFFFHN